jgi:hypothetical protein
VSRNWTPAGLVTWLAGANTRLSPFVPPGTIRRYLTCAINGGPAFRNPPLSNASILLMRGHRTNVQLQSSNEATRIPRALTPGRLVTKMRSIGIFAALSDEGTLGSSAGFTSQQ